MREKGLWEMPLLLQVASRVFPRFSFIKKIIYIVMRSYSRVVIILAPVTRQSLRITFSVSMQLSTMEYHTTPRKTIQYGAI